MRFLVIIILQYFSFCSHAQNFQFDIKAELNKVLGFENNDVVYCLSETYNKDIVTIESLRILFSESSLEQARNKGKRVKLNKMENYMNHCSCYADSILIWKEIVKENDSLFSEKLNEYLLFKGKKDYLDLDSLEQIEFNDFIENELKDSEIPYNGPYHIIEIDFFQKFSEELYCIYISKFRIGNLRIRRRSVILIENNNNIVRVESKSID